MAIIRLATQQDALQIVALIHELAAGSGEQSPLDPDYVHTYLAAGGSNFLVAEEKGLVAGLLSYSIRPNLYHAGPAALIEELVVSGGQRGLGLGGLLLEELLRRAQAAGCAEVSVSTLVDNQDAQRFYRRHGLVDEAVLLEKHFTQP